MLALEPLLALAPLVAASGDAPPDVAPLSRLSRRVGRALCGGAGGQRGVGRRGGEGERRRGREGARAHRGRLTVRTESDGVVYGWPDRSSCKAGAAHA